MNWSSLSIPALRLTTPESSVTKQPKPCLRGCSSDPLDAALMAEARRRVVNVVACGDARHQPPDAFAPPIHNQGHPIGRRRATGREPAQRHKWLAPKPVRADGRTVGRRTPQTSVARLLVGCPRARLPRRAPPTVSWHSTSTNPQPHRPRFRRTDQCELLALPPERRPPHSGMQLHEAGVNEERRPHGLRTPCPPQDC